MGLSPEGILQLLLKFFCSLLFSGFDLHDLQDLLVLPDLVNLGLDSVKSLVELLEVLIQDTLLER